MKVLSTTFMLLVIATSAFAGPANKKGGGGAAGGHARSEGGNKGDAGRTGMMHQGGAMHQGNAMHGNTANSAKHGQGPGSHFHEAKGNRMSTFSTKSTHGQVAFHSRAGATAALHSHVSGSLQARAFHAQKYSAVLQSYHPIFHERTWWVAHYNRVVLIGGGWYYWDAGYWYPAWGYDPAAVYIYDGPIYSYDNLPPDEVIMNVQSELEFQGYYHGPIDGQLGPQTRSAIAEFQRDHELEITSAIDEPTVNLLGLA
jgi:Putative peptidoglycan binding domain